MEKYEKGHEPIATRAMICRTLGKLGDPRAARSADQGGQQFRRRDQDRVLSRSGKVGRPEDATILAQVMTLDNLEDARIAAIEGLADIKTKDTRIYQMLVENMDHEDPAIRLASLNALRKLTARITAPIPPTGGSSSSRCSTPLRPSAARQKPAGPAVKARPASRVSAANAAAGANATATQDPLT